MYYGPKDRTPLREHSRRFGGNFFILEPSGGLAYERYENEALTMNLSDENDEKLLALIEKSAAEGKDLVYEAYKDKAFDPYPDPDCDY